MTTPANRRPIVFLIAQPSVSRNKQPLDISGLYKHGDVEVLCPAGDSPSYKPQAVIRSMANRLEGAGFDPSVDFIVWAGGDTLASLMLGMIFGVLGYEKFNWLRYERGRAPDGRRTDEGAEYVPILVDITTWANEVYDEAEDGGIPGLADAQRRAS